MSKKKEKEIRTIMRPRSLIKLEELLPEIVCIKAEVEDIQAFIDSFFTPKPPFFLFGLSVKMGEEYYKVKGVDLVLGQKYWAEVSRSFLRFYIRDNEATTNRIIALLKHYRKSHLNVKRVKRVQPLRGEDFLGKQKGE